MFDGKIRALVVKHFAFAAGDASDDAVAFVSTVEDGLGFLYSLGRNYDDEADAHIEGAEHLILFDIAELLEMLEERRDGPGGEVDGCAHAFGDDAREVLGDASAGDVGHTVDDFGPGELLDDGEVAAVGAHEGGTGLVLEFVDVLLGAIFRDFKQQFAGEGVAVGVQAIGRQADEYVADLDFLACDDVLAADGADDRASKIVFAVGVEARHLGGLATDEGAAVGAACLADALDDGLDDLIFEFACGEVVQEEERRRALHGDVIDAVVDEI